MGGDLDRHPAGDLAHRDQERKRAIGRLDGFVSDRRHAPLNQLTGQLLIGSQVEVGKEQQPRPEKAELAWHRLLDLDY